MVVRRPFPPRSAWDRLRSLGSPQLPIGDLTGVSVFQSHGGVDGCRGRGGLRDLLLLRVPRPLHPELPGCAPGARLRLNLHRLPLRLLLGGKHHIRGRLK